MNEVTVEQMKALEHAADAAGLSYLQMMENAGRGAVDVLLQYEPKPENVYIFCGKGNNGGDGFVAARLLKEKGISVTAVLTQGIPVTQDAKENYDRCLAVGVRVTQIAQLTRDDEAAVKNACVLDAVYGTGFHGQLRPDGLLAAQWINKGRFVLAFDLPSGVQADTGTVAQGAVKADVTVTFYAPKACHRLAKAQCGDVVTAQIGITEVLHKA